MTLKTISYGGGVQSTAMLVLAVAGRIEADTAVFANVGDDSEHPDALAYVRDIAVPWAASHGLTVHTLDRVRRDGSTETLMGRLTNSRSIPIPVRMSNGAPGRRNCTSDFKIKVVGKWLKANGATPTDPATVHIGISTDEIHRAAGKKSLPYETPSYPLLDLGLSRLDCQKVIADAGLPVPGKSSCFFCPFHRPQRWAEMRRDEPELFARSVALEHLLNERRVMRGKDPVYLTRFLKPLDEAIGQAQTMLPIFDMSPDTGTCDDGYCFT